MWRSTRRHLHIANKSQASNHFTPAQRAILGSMQLREIAKNDLLRRNVLKPVRRLEYLLELMLDQSVMKVTDTKAVDLHALITAKCQDPYLREQAMNSRCTRTAGSMLKLHNSLRANDVPLPFCVGANAGGTMNLISVRGQLPDVFLPTTNDAKQHVQTLNEAMNGSIDALYVDEMLLLCAMTQRRDAEIAGGDLSGQCIDVFLADTLVRRGMFYEMVFDSLDGRTPMLCRKLGKLDEIENTPRDHSAYLSCNRSLTRFITKTLLRKANKQASTLLRNAAAQKVREESSRGLLEHALSAKTVRQDVLRGSIIPRNQPKTHMTGLTMTNVASPVFVDVLNLNASSRAEEPSSKKSTKKAVQGDAKNGTQSKFAVPIKSHRLKFSWPGLHRIAAGCPVAFIILEGRSNEPLLEQCANLCLNARVQNEVYQLILASRVTNSKLGALVESNNVAQIKSLMRKHSVLSNSKFQLTKQAVAQMCAHNCKGLQVLCGGTTRSKGRTKTWAAIRTGSGVTQNFGAYFNNTVIEDATSSAMCQASFSRVKDIHKLMASTLPRNGSACSASTLAFSVRVWLGTLLSGLSYMAMLHAVTKQMFVVETLSAAESFIDRCTYTCYMQEGRLMTRRNSCSVVEAPSQLCLAFWLPLRQNLNVANAFSESAYRSYRPFFGGSARNMGTELSLNGRIAIDKSVVPLVDAAYRALSASLGKTLRHSFKETLLMVQDFAARYSNAQMQNNGNMSLALCRYSAVLQEICETECMTYDLSNGMM
eukprot:jgi/Bigna1/129903/aug1.10_g4611